MLCGPRRPGVGLPSQRPAALTWSGSTVPCQLFQFFPQLPFKEGQCVGAIFPMSGLQKVYVLDLGHHGPRNVPSSSSVYPQACRTPEALGKGRLRRPRSPCVPYGTCLGGMLAALGIARGRKAGPSRPCASLIFSFHMLRPLAAGSDVLCGSGHQKLTCGQGTSRTPADI